VQFIAHTLHSIVGNVQAVNKYLLFASNGIRRRNMLKNLAGAGLFSIFMS